MKKIIKTFIAVIFSFALFSACNQNNGHASSTIVSQKVTRADWGTVDGKKVYLYTLTNKNNVQVKISNYGGTMTSWILPDKDGNESSIILGFDSLSGYLAHPPYFGATIGRYGNRIAKGTFKIDSTTYSLAKNDGENHLHGGNKGFDKVVWEASPAKDSSASLILNYLSKDGEEGYPGNLNVTVTYTLTDDNELQIEYAATTDKATPVNLTNHSYFNLSGDPSISILNELLQIDAEKYTPVDKGLIPTGELKAVKGTAFDFLQPHKIGERIDSVPGGYDHNFVLNRSGKGMEKVATLFDSLSGRTLEVYTDEPGLQFYSGNFLDGKFKTNKGVPINKYAALCLETQHFPDSPNQSSFPSTILKPGQEYHTISKYKVSIIK